MPRTRSSWIVLIAVITLLGGAWISTNRVQTGDADLPSRPTSPDAGSLAPDFTLLTLDGEEITLSELRGRPVLLNFWATWCPPCRVEIPALEQAWRELDGDVIVLGVDVQESANTVQAFAEDAGITYPVALDLEAEVARAYRVRAFPTTYFIDSDGVIVEVFSGPLSEPLLYTRLTGIAGR